jgi:hypothetical protein
MAAKKKTSPWVWVLLAAVAGGGGYLYYRHEQQQKAAAAAAALSSNQAQGVTPLPMDLPSPMEYPNSMSGTPTIQNFVTGTQPATSTQTTIIQPIISAFHHKPGFVQPHHPPTSPMAPHRSGWITP